MAKRHTDYTSVKQDNFLESLELTEAQFTGLYSVLDSVAQDAYNDGFEDGENEND